MHMLLELMLIVKLKAYIANPIVVDEMEDIARIAGHPLFERVSIFHALNQKAVARTVIAVNQKVAKKLGVVLAEGVMEKASKVN